MSNIKNLLGLKLTRYEIDDFIDENKFEEIHIRTDFYGFKMIKDFYDGWIGLPKIAEKLIYMDGVHPHFMKKMFVSTTLENKSGEIRFFDREGELLGEIVNYYVI